MKTDQEFQQLFPKLLPGKVFWNTGLEKLYWLKQPEFPMRQGWVIETELLSLCRMVEETFTSKDSINYYNELYEIVCEDYNKQNGKWAIAGQSQKRIHYLVAHASWRRRIQAASKVKGERESDA